MNELRELKKASQAIHISSEITLLQRKAFNVLLANAYDKLPFQEEFEINVDDLMLFLDIEKNNFHYLKTSLYKMMDHKVQWNILNKDKKQEWGAAVLLPSVRIVDNTLYYVYVKSIRELLHNPRMFAKINLSLQNKFKSSYSLVLYELFQDYKNLGFTQWIDLITYKKLLGIDENEYKEYKRLSIRAIKNPIAEIEQKTNFKIEVQTKKRNRVVSELRFIIKEKKQNIDKNIDGLRNKLLGFKMTVEVINEILQDYEHNTIWEWIIAIQNGFVEVDKNAAGYIIAALRNNYPLPLNYQKWKLKEKEIENNRPIIQPKNNKTTNIIAETDMFFSNAVTKFNPLPCPNKIQIIEKIKSTIQANSCDLILLRTLFSDYNITDINELNLELFEQIINSNKSSLGVSVLLEHLSDLI